MAEKYTIREAKIEIGDGITVTVEVDSLAGLKQVLEDAKALDMQREARPAWLPAHEPRVPQDRSADVDDPLERVALKASIDPGALRKANVLGFKDDTPQLLRPQVFSVTDAMIVLLFAVETGLKRPKSDFEGFRGLYEAQNIKSGSPYSMRTNDLKNGGYIDKKVYDSGRIISLTAKGEQKAIEVLRKAAERT